MPTGSRSRRASSRGLGLTWNPLTTQIESHDWQAELYADVARFNRILHNVCTDIWSYISIGYFRQIPVRGATGSSTMPHKVNPIRFENAEANLEISSALLDALAATLVTSRWQRDLTDSSSQRNIGVAFGHSLLAIDNVARRPGPARRRRGRAGRRPRRELGSPGRGDPDGHARRGHRRRRGMENPYERLKDLTRGQRVDARPDAGVRPGPGPVRRAEATAAGPDAGRYTGHRGPVGGHLSERGAGPTFPYDDKEQAP